MTVGKILSHFNLWINILIYTPICNNYFVMEKIIRYFSNVEEFLIKNAIGPYPVSIIQERPSPRNFPKILKEYYETTNQIKSKN